ncbi:MAG: hypothetical protein ACRDD2_08280 [Sarcina sp.]
MKTLKVGRGITIPAMAIFFITGAVSFQYFREHFKGLQDDEYLKKAIIWLILFCAALTYELVRNYKIKQVIKITEEGINCREASTNNEVFIKWKDIKDIAYEANYLNPKGNLIRIYVNEKYDDTHEVWESMNVETKKVTIERVVDIDTSETMRTEEICNVIEYNLKVFNKEEIEDNKIAVVKGLLDLVNDEGIAKATGLDVNIVTEIRLENMK